MIVRRKRLIVAGVIVVALVTVLGLTKTPNTTGMPSMVPTYAPTKGIHFTAPTLDEVKSIQVVLNFPVKDPNPIVSDSPQNRVEINMIVRWFASSKPLGYEISHPIPMEGPTQLDIILNDGQQIDIQPALDETVEKQEGRTTYAMKPSDSSIVVLRGNNHLKSICLYSPRLAQWLTEGWRNDIPRKLHSVTLRRKGHRWCKQGWLLFSVDRQGKRGGHIRRTPPNQISTRVVKPAGPWGISVDIPTRQAG